MPLAYPAVPDGEQWIGSYTSRHAMALTNTAASAAWPSSNRAIYIPMYLDSDGVVTQLWTMNGATANGDVDMGIYDASGARLTSIGPTAQSGTSAPQVFDITDIYLPAGAYYLARSHSNTTGTNYRMATVAPLLRMFGLLQQASAGTLPSSMTGTTVASAYWPVCGITYRSI